MTRFAIALGLSLFAFAGCGDDDYGHERGPRDLTAPIEDLSLADTAAPVDVAVAHDLAVADLADAAAPGDLGVDGGDDGAPDAAGD